MLRVCGFSATWNLIYEVIVFPEDVFPWGCGVLRQVLRWNSVVSRGLDWVIRGDFFAGKSQSRAALCISRGKNSINRARVSGFTPISQGQWSWGGLLAEESHSVPQMRSTDEEHCDLTFQLLSLMWDWPFHSFRNSLLFWSSSGEDGLPEQSVRVKAGNCSLW